MSKVTQSMIHNARLWADDALELLGFSHVVVRIEFNERFTSKLGDARFKSPGPRIRLSAPMWPIVPAAQRRETVIHEICHIAVMAEHDQRKRDGYRGKHPKAHGPEWKAKMVACGLEPHRCHSVDLGLVPGTRRTMRLHCDCPKLVAVTPSMYNAVVSGMKTYRCRTCKAKLHAEPRPILPTPAKPKTAAQRLSEYIRKVKS